MKRSLIILGAVLLVFGAVAGRAFAQLDSNVDINGVSPNPVTNQITVTGDAESGYWDSGIDCPRVPGLSGFVDRPFVSPLSNPYYFIDGSYDGSTATVTAPGGKFSYTLTQTVQGHNGACGAAPAAQPVQYQYTYSFTDSSHMASLTPGSHTLYVCATGDDFNGNRRPYCDSATFTISGATSTPTSTPIGTITVTSENMVHTSTAVYAKWDVTASTTNVVRGFVCSATGELNSRVFPWIDGTPCSGTYQAYKKVPANNDLVGVSHTATTTVPYYTFDSIKQVPIAEKKDTNILSSLKSSFGNIFSTVALAQTVEVLGPDATYYPVGSLLLTPSQTVAFVILWNPDANMKVQPNAVRITSSASSSPVTITDTGAPYSTLTWTTTATTVDGGNWLGVTSGGSVMNGAAGGANGATSTATISYLGGEPAGTYHGTVTFYGINGNIGLGLPFASTTVSVTLTVSGSSTSTPPGNPGNPTSTPPGGPGNPSSTPPGGPGNPTSTPPGGGAPACTPGVNCPVCSPSLTATPSTIVVPEASDLSYSCSHVTECQLTQDDTGQLLQDLTAGAGETIDTTQNPYAVTPTINTAYTVTCGNSNYAQEANINPISSSATVIVSGSSYCEQNPNGVGCQ